MKPIMHIHGWTSLLKSIAGKHDLRVEFTTDTDSVMVQGDRVTVPVPTSEWTEKDFDNVLFGVDSYGSMWRYGAQAFPEFAELPHDKPLGWMIREFEQHRTMREAGDEFRGSKNIMSKGVGNRMEDHIVPAVEKCDPKVQAMLLHGAEGSSHWNTGYAESVGPMMVNVLKNAEAKGFVDKLDEMEFQEKLNALENPADSLALAKEVFAQLWEEDPDEQEDKEREEGKGQGEGEGGASLEGENPHSGGDASDGEQEEGKTYRVDSDGNVEPPEGGHGVRVETAPPSGRYPDWEDPLKLEHVDLKASPTHHPNRGKVDGWIKHETSGMDANAAMFANRLRRHIMVASQSFYTHGHKRGKIGTKHLYKLAVEHPMPGEDRMFKRKHDSDMLDTAVSVLVDYSGSMYGSRTALTAIGTDLMVHALNVLGVPCEVNMFTTIHEGTTLYTVKHFDEKVTSEVLMDRSERAAHRQSNNNDAAAVQWAYERLARRPEKKKILLVLSDGHPATHNVSNPQEALLTVTQEIERDPRVDLMGLGIESNAVGRYYTQHVVVDDADDMPTALIDLVANKMLADNERS